jgi:predicted cation transporter
VVSLPAEPVWGWVAGLVVIALLVLVLPFRVKWCEHNLEIFFLIMGILSVSISTIFSYNLWSIDLVTEALKAPVMIGSLPIGIFQVVLIFGLLIYFFNKAFYRAIIRLLNKLSIRVFIFILIFFLGIVSSITSVIVTSVILSEIVAALPLNRSNRIKLIVVACFAVGLGAVLTPLGEPMSTILVQRLSGPPYNAGFTWPINHFAIYVIPACLALGIFGAIWIGKTATMPKTGKAVITNADPGPLIDPVDVAGTTADQITEYSETLRTVILRSVKVFAFVAALVLLGTGLQPLIVWFLIKVPALALYWINMISAVLDNATLTAIEVSSQMELAKIVAVVMGLLIAGGMLIPGNIPNIVAAGRLKISMREWAVLGIPIGLVILMVFFVILIVTGGV